MQATTLTPGWTHIVATLVEAVALHEHRSGTPGQWRAMQVREQYGRLRIVSTGATSIPRRSSISRC